jgi:hypothetical protein
MHDRALLDFLVTFRSERPYHTGYDSFALAIYSPTYSIPGVSKCNGKYILTWFSHVGSNLNQGDKSFNSTLAQLQLSAYCSPVSRLRLSESILDTPESTENPQATQTDLPPGLLNTSSSKKLNIKDVVGGVVGGITMIFVFCVTLFWCIRRRRKAVASSNLVQMPTPYPSTAEVSHLSTSPRPKLYVSACIAVGFIPSKRGLFLQNQADPSTFPLLTLPATNTGRVNRTVFFGTTVTDLPPRYSRNPEV